jgi:hypothetical protein
MGVETKRIVAEENDSPITVKDTEDRDEVA